jgi:hypothetical protein
LYSNYPFGKIRDSAVLVLRSIKTILYPLPSKSNAFL